MKNIILETEMINIKSNGFSLESKGMENGYIKEKHGKYGKQNINGMPSLSIPLEWKNIPEKVKSYALVMEDYDAIPVTGFSWIHWVVLIPGDYTCLKENASLEDKKLIQGVNSWISDIGGLNKDEASHYGGSAPPDKEHTYTFRLYALDKEIELERGFYLNELYREIEGHILDVAVLKGKYKN